MSDSQITLGGLVRAFGLPVWLVCVTCVIVGIVLLVRGHLAKRRGEPTVRHHWWLIALMRVVLLVGASKFLWKSVSAYEEVIRRSNEMGSSKGVVDFLLIEAYRNAHLLLLTVAVALFLALCILVLGSPRQERGPNEEADLPPE